MKLKKNLVCLMIRKDRGWSGAGEEVGGKRWKGNQNTTLKALTKTVVLTGASVFPGDIG